MEESSLSSLLLLSTAVENQEGGLDVSVVTVEEPIADAIADDDCDDPCILLLLNVADFVVHALQFNEVTNKIRRRILIETMIRFDWQLIKKG